MKTYLLLLSLSLFNISAKYPIFFDPNFIEEHSKERQYLNKRYDEEHNRFQTNWKMILDKISAIKKQYSCTINDYKLLEVLENNEKVLHEQWQTYISKNKERGLILKETICKLAALIAKEQKAIAAIAIQSNQSYVDPDHNISGKILERLNAVFIAAD
jgi:Skp family chaperone for outer membrane proteins